MKGDSTMGMAGLRMRGLAVVGAAVLVAVLAPASSGPVAMAADDVTPPVGTFVIGDGSGYARSLTVVLHVPATDDVGVTTLRIENGGQLHEMPYAPEVEWTFPNAQRHSVRVQWLDAAGNGSTERAEVVIDTTPPEVGWVKIEADASPTTMRAVLGNFSDDGSSVSHVRFRSGGGPWGAPIVAPQSNPMVIPWSVLDPAAGGSPALGRRTVQVQARNRAGLWSSAVSATAFVTMENAEMVVSGDARSGHDVTFTPGLADAVYPAGTVCTWALFWGNDRSIYYGEHDDTYGSIEAAGPASAGYCDPWTVTLPWVPYPQFAVAFHAETADGPILSASIGTSPEEPALTPGVDSTSRHIERSSIPIVYVLPDKYELTVGQPATYRAYPVGGASIGATDLWQVNYGETPERKYGGTSFTFTPKVVGYLTVCWLGGKTRSYLIGACFDPPARRPDRTKPNTSAPVHQFVAGTSGTYVPTKISWSGTDKGWGIAWYRLERSLNGGPWAKVTLPTATATSIAQNLLPGARVRYRVRATDKVGNVGAWDYGRTFTIARVPDHDPRVLYSTGWAMVADATAFGGVLHETSKVGGASSFTFTGSDIAWVAEIGPGHGQAKVYLDGVYQSTVDLNAASPSPRRLVYRKHYAAVGTHTIRILVVGTAGRPIVSHDGFAILR